VASSAAWEQGALKAAPAQTITPQTFGATGNGVTDDTAAMQAWLNDIVATGIPGYLPPAVYKISSPITLSGSGSFSIYGSGQNLASTILLASGTQDGLVISLSAGRILLKDFAIQAAPSASGGAGIRVTGATNVTILGIVDNISCLNCYDGIDGSGLSTSFFTRLSLTASHSAISMKTFGDSTIEACYLNPTGSGTGILLNGDPGGARIINNKINGSYQYGIEVIINASDGDLLINSNSIEGSSGYGIIISRTGSATFNNIVISGNQLSSLGHGISVGNDTSSAYIGDVVVSGNVIDLLTAARQAIYMGNVGSFSIADNQIYGSAGGGINVLAGAQGTIHDNSIVGQTTPINNLASAVIIHDNIGYNPSLVARLSLPGRR
jgi:hypothetical protein